MSMHAHRCVCVTKRIKKNEDTKMRKNVNLLKQQLALSLRHTTDLTINHAVISVTPLQIHANDTMIRKAISVKDPVTEN